MPISFACECGKAFRVDDKFAGKRSKCTACGSAVLVPTPANDLTDEELAYQALSEGPEPEPAKKDWREPSFSAPAQSPVARPVTAAVMAEAKPVVKKKAKKARSRDPYAPREREWQVDWGTIVGGIIAVLFGTTLLLGGLAFNRIFIWTPVIIIGGIITIIKGLLNKE